MTFNINNCHTYLLNLLHLTLGTQAKKVQAFAKRHVRPATTTRDALDSLLSAQRKGLLAIGSDLSSDDDTVKAHNIVDSTSEDDKSDVSIKLPARTGDFDKDITPTPKVSKDKSGLKIKRSKSSSTSECHANVRINEAADSNSSDFHLPCSGTVSSKYEKS